MGLFNLQRQQNMIFLDKNFKNLWSIVKLFQLKRPNATICLVHNNVKYTPKH
jgi:hypothetical protein